MTSFQRAIKLAVEGGYEPSSNLKGLPFEIIMAKIVDIRPIFLDPLFWQALGKAMGWKIGDDYDYLYNASESLKVGQGKMDDWLYHAHRFLDHVLASKPAESFFSELLTKQE